jgi:hypothetical protein
MHGPSNEPEVDRKDEPELTGVDLIAALRGGYPEKCDFCEQAYTPERHPVPEEAGLWACSVCWDRWEEMDRAQLAREGNAGQ